MKIFNCMEKFFGNLKELFEREDINVTTFEKSIGASQGVFSRAMRNKTTINVNWVIKLLEKYPLYNANWLLRDTGEKFLVTPEESHLEPKNWIKDDQTRYEGSHDPAALERVGLRIDEICKVKNMSYDAICLLLGVERITLLNYIAGNEPVPASFLDLMMDCFPDIRPTWLLLGYGGMFKELKEQK